MRHGLIVILILAFICAGCASSKNIDGKDVNPIGLVGQISGVNLVGVEKPAPCVSYQIVWGNVVWGAILLETVIAPIYFYGFSMFEPVGKQDGCKG